MFKISNILYCWILKNIQSISIFPIKNRAQNSVTGSPSLPSSFSPPSPPWQSCHLHFYEEVFCKPSTVVEANFTSLLSTFPFCALWQVLVALGKLSWSCKWTIIALCFLSWPVSVGNAFLELSTTLWARGGHVSQAWPILGPSTNQQWWLVQELVTGTWRSNWNPPLGRMTDAKK